jgi:hypothetical protein
MCNRDEDGPRVNGAVGQCEGWRGGSERTSSM